MPGAVVAVRRREERQTDPSPARLLAPSALRVHLDDLPRAAERSVPSNKLDFLENWQRTWPEQPRAHHLCVSFTR